MIFARLFWLCEKAQNYKMYLLVYLVNVSSDIDTTSL